MANSEIKLHLIKVYSAVSNFHIKIIKPAECRLVNGEHPTFLHVIANETKWSEAIAKSPKNNKPMRLLKPPARYTNAMKFMLFLKNKT